MICYRGKASDLAKTQFGVLPLRSGGVRWYSQWEQMEQILSFEIDKIMSMTSFCVEKEWSKESSKKLQQLVTPSTLPKLLVEMNAVVEVGRVFCQSTYTLEGDDPLVFTAYLVFERLNKTISELGNANSLSNTRQACKTASNLVSNLKQTFLEELSLRKHKRQHWQLQFRLFVKIESIRIRKVQLKIWKHL